MATWVRILQEPELVEYLRELYGTLFPIEIRHALADWMENCFRAANHLDPNNVGDNARIKDMMLNMATEMERKIMPGSRRPYFENRDISNVLSHWISNIRANCPDHIVLFQHLQRCLQTELEILPPNSLPRPAPESPPQFAEMLQLDSKLSNVQDNYLVQLRSTLEKLRNCQLELSSIFEDVRPGSQQFDRMNELQQKEADFRNLDHELNMQTKTCVHELQELLDKVLHEARRWKQETKFIYEGKLSGTSITLFRLGQIVTALAQHLWATRNVIMGEMTAKMAYHAYFPATTSSSSSEAIGPFMGPAMNILPFEGLKAQVEEMLQKLVFDTTIVKVQPYQMLKSDTKFNTILQLLAFVPMPNQEQEALSLPRIKIALLTDRQASTIFNDFGSMHSRITPIPPLVKREGPKIVPVPNWIDSDSAIVEITDEQEHCAVFKSPKIKKSFKREIEEEVSKISRKRVDVNYFIYYSGQFEVNGIIFNIGAFSYPVKVITNGCQEMNCWETGIWDLATGSLYPGQAEGLKPPATCENLFRALNVTFFRQTGRGFTQENIDFIIQTLLPLKLSQQIRLNRLTGITFEQFCMHAIDTERSFSLWEWLFCAMKFITEHLKGPKRPGRSQKGIWDQGCIMGFVNAEVTQDLLYSRRHEVSKGFVLRFSPNVLNTITIEWIVDNSIFCTRITRKDLCQRTLADRVLDLPELEMMYNVDKNPIPKSSVFEYSASQVHIPPPREAILSHGSVVVQYVKNVLCTHVLVNGSSVHAHVHASASTSTSMQGPPTSNMIRTN